MAFTSRGSADLRAAASRGRPCAPAVVERRRMLWDERFPGMDGHVDVVAQNAVERLRCARGISSRPARSESDGPRAQRAPRELRQLRTAGGGLQVRMPQRWCRSGSRTGALLREAFEHGFDGVSSLSRASGGAPDSTGSPCSARFRMGVLRQLERDRSSASRCCKIASVRSNALSSR